MGVQEAVPILDQKVSLKVVLKVVPRATLKVGHKVDHLVRVTEVALVLVGLHLSPDKEIQNIERDLDHDLILGINRSVGKKFKKATGEWIGLED